MREIIKNIFIGTIDDYALCADDNTMVTIIAAKEPYHRNIVGYMGRSCGKEHPEYLFAERENLLVCNLVDVENPEWISPIIIDKIFSFVDEAESNGKKVLICCNQGRSRSATIGLMYLRHKKFGVFSDLSFEEAEKYYSECFYSEYAPANGIREYARQHWEEI